MKAYENLTRELFAERARLVGIVKEIDEVLEKLKGIRATPELSAVVSSMIFSSNRVEIAPTPIWTPKPSASASFRSKEEFKQLVLDCFGPNDVELSTSTLYNRMCELGYSSSRSPKDSMKRLRERLREERVLCTVATSGISILWRKFP